MARVTLHNMRQDYDDPVCSSCVRLRTSFETKDSGKRSASRLLDSQTVQAASSSYKRQSRQFKASQPQPFVNLVLRILPEDYEAFGFNMTKRTNTVAISAMADTGCQSCLAGIKVIHRLGINQTELIPVNMKMHAANNKGITILGATILRISGKDDQVPVPIHWKEEVKAGLDQDVRLGVLEPVPVGEPVTWCHRMVVCAKKNGKPRRTVDFQPLNVQATRETHHTFSPLRQTRSVPNGKRKTVFDAWMAGTAIIVFQFLRRIAIWLLSLHPGADIVTKRLHKVI
ncbi:unnamed protein product [Mytilus edulis]|uniref:Uncharacterized protein n=1 Tax=Mytilus edulis TaxID=6550 RepID=A0A8S3STH6_MYTED|nr:unnamed protein product [Mytilus edulis]